MESLLGNTRKADVVFHASGRMDIASRAARLLRLSAGDVVDVMSDGEELYLYVRCRTPVAGRHEARVFPSNRRGRHFRACSKKLCAAVLRAAGVAGSARLCIGQPLENPCYGTLLPIITRLIL